MTGYIVTVQRAGQMKRLLVNGSSRSECEELIDSVRNPHGSVETYKYRGWRIVEMERLQDSVVEL